MYVGFTTSEAAFKKELKRLKSEDTDFMASDHANATTHFLTSDGGNYCAIICLGPIKERTLAQVAALLAHEATHVAQRLWRHIGEHEVGDETEAYFIQMVTQCCLEQLEQFKAEAN